MLEMWIADAERRLGRLRRAEELQCEAIDAYRRELANGLPPGWITRCGEPGQKAISAIRGILR